MRPGDGVFANGQSNRRSEPPRICRRLHFLRDGPSRADLVMGKAHQGAIVTLAERCCKLYLASPIVRKTAALTSQAITDLLSDFKAVVHAITYDNGPGVQRPPGHQSGAGL